ncbi:head maturation protease, ClpP-related [Magnetococcus sp. PR-3]|uniref:head maturation protease, ClpP-related n=1 Tax=Magnetococcus sp. PR-3 TaxID=3120355 RepID=UPI002FCDEC06
MSRTWFRITAKGDAPAEIAIYDEIGAYGITAKSFLDELKKVEHAKAITLRVNSPGGSVFDGIAIHNALKRHTARVTVFVDGIAASIASVIAMAGDEVVMPENAMMMIHDPSGLVWGTADEMRSMAEALDKMKAGLVSAYREKTGRSDEEIEALMANESWLTAEEAVEMGFADRVDKPVQMAAFFDLGRFKNTPECLTNCELSHPEPKQPQNNVVDLDSVRSDERKKTLAYVNEVHEICDLAGMPGRASNFIAQGVEAGQIRRALIDARADEGDRLDIRHRHGPALDEHPQPTIDTHAIYAARNQPNP